MNSKVLQRRLKRYLRECFAVAVIFTTALYVIDRPSLNRNLIQNVQQKIFSIVQFHPTGYIDNLQNLMSGQILPSGAVTQRKSANPSMEEMNIGYVMVNLNNTGSTLPDWKAQFVTKTIYTISMMLRQVGSRPIHFVIVTDRASGSWAGQILASIVSKRLTTDVIQERYFLWRRSKALPPLRFSLVDSEEILHIKPDFVEAIYSYIENPKKDKPNVYNARLFYVAPLYHLAFKNLDKIIFLDCKDLEFMVDLSELYDQFDELDKDKEAIMSMGHDLAPHYLGQLKKYKKMHPDTELGQPGRFQGLNTGVVLYRLDRMRKSDIYAKYLTPEGVQYLFDKYMYKVSLAEQDLFTNIDFDYPKLIKILPCQFNAQMSIQYMYDDLKSVFPQYHDCDSWDKIKIFHINGCGPTLSLCLGEPERYSNKNKVHWYHVNPDVPASQNLVQDVHKKIQKSFKYIHDKKPKKPFTRFVQPLAAEEHVERKEFNEAVRVINKKMRDHTEQLEKEKNITYTPRLENLIKGVLVPPSEVVTPVPDAINLGLIIIHIGEEQKFEPKFEEQKDPFDLLVMNWYGFAFKTLRTLNLIMERAGTTPIHFIIVTNQESASFAGRLVGTIITKRLAMDIILTRDYKWRRHQSIPPVYFSLVDSDYMIDLNPGFAQGMMDNQMKTKSDDKYRSKFYFIAPNYHKAFTSLDKAVFIDGTDLEFTVDVKELWDQYEALDNSTALMSMGLDLTPHYFMFLSGYLKDNPDSKFGQPGRFQGFNTGVVLYRFDRMRESELYNSYLTREKVNEVIKMFKYEVSLAEQDFFTNLGFIHPEIFHILPCEFNRQVSIQYNRPPYEEVFHQYHDCVPKDKVKIFHLNGCGPTPAQCGNTPDPSWKTYDIRNKSQFLHMDIEAMWSHWAYMNGDEDEFLKNLVYQDAIQMNHLRFKKGQESSMG